MLKAWQKTRLAAPPWPSRVCDLAKLPKSTQAVSIVRWGWLAIGSVSHAGQHSQTRSSGALPMQ